MINSTAIRTAIAELLEGSIGSVRTMATTEWLDQDGNDFSSWTYSLASVTANQAYGPSGEYTADSLWVGAGLIGSKITTVPDNTVVTGSVYVKSNSGTKQFKLSIVKKDGNAEYSSDFTATTEWVKYSIEDIDVLSGATEPSFSIIGLGDGDTLYIAEAHCTSDSYLFAKKRPWNDAIIESNIEPSDGKLIVNTRYDIRFTQQIQHEASPVSAIGSHKIDEIDITIELTHKLDSNIQEDNRDSLRERILYNGDRIIQALHYPNNLDQTSASVATGIVSGMLYDLTHGIENENWEEKPPRIVSMIRGKAAVHNTQLTS